MHGIRLKCASRRFPCLLYNGIHKYIPNKQVGVPDSALDAKAQPVGVVLPAAGLLTRRLRRTPSRDRCPNGPLSTAVVSTATHSCATVRDSHAIPSWPTHPPVCRTAAKCLAFKVLPLTPSYRITLQRYNNYPYPGHQVINVPLLITDYPLIFNRQHRQKATLAKTNQKNQHFSETVTNTPLQPLDLQGRSDTPLTPLLLID